MIWLAVYVVVCALWIPLRIWVVFSIPLIQLTDEDTIGGLYGSLKKLRQRGIPRAAWVVFTLLWPLYAVACVLLGIVTTCLRVSLNLTHRFVEKPKKSVHTFGKSNLKATPK